MDHPCHRCRATVEDGVPFCPHCGAPQIRVAGVTVPEEAATPAFPAGTPGEVTSPAEPVPLEVRGVQWSHGVRAVALAALLLATSLLFVPGLVAVGVGPALHLGQGAQGLLALLVMCGCIAAGGTVAVMLYRRRQPDTLITSGMGARLGAVTALPGFFIYGLMQLILFGVLKRGGSVAEWIRKAIQQAAAQNPDPRAQEIMSNLLSPGALAAFITFMVVMFFLLFLIFGTLGGVLGASVWGSKKSS